MKKQVFGMVAALFALMLALFVGAYAADTSAAELSAADNVYAILYEDGTLVFQNSNTPEPGRTVKKTYPVDLTVGYTWNFNAQSANTPWYNERNSIRVVNFADKISPQATAYWFHGCKNLERVDNIQNLDTSNVTDMRGMFYRCSGLTALDVSHFDTAKVTDMSQMFDNCSGLTALDVSNFDTKNVTGMSWMFDGCSGLTALDVSHFDTANVTGMSYMFSYCSGLTVLDVSHFDTANVTNMSYMFSYCSGLTVLDVSHFDTANVTGMSYMFSYCSGLTVLDVSHFDTKNITDSALLSGYYGMFFDCANLKTIYASNKFTTASVTFSQNMFSGCTSLVGGNGTTYDESHTDKEYARIDTASAPGYFTAKDAAPVPYEITALIPNADTKILTVKLTNPAAATVFVAYFDTKGQFLTTDMKAVPANAGSVELKLLNVNRARVSMFDDQYRPLCSPYVSVLGA